MTAGINSKLERAHSLCSNNLLKIDEENEQRTQDHEKLAEYFNNRDQQFGSVNTEDNVISIRRRTGRVKAHRKKKAIKAKDLEASLFSGKNLGEIQQMMEEGSTPRPLKNNPGRKMSEDVTIYELHESYSSEDSSQDDDAA